MSAASVTKFKRRAKPETRFPHKRAGDGFAAFVKRKPDLARELKKQNPFTR